MGKDRSWLDKPETIKDISESEFWQNIIKDSPFWEGVFESLIEDSSPIDK